MVRMVSFFTFRPHTKKNIKPEKLFTTPLEATKKESITNEEIKEYFDTLRKRYHASRK